MTQRGAPLGNQNNKKGRDWSNAVRSALLEEDPARKRSRLRCVAEKVVELAMAGDMEAIKEIGNRLDGRPIQELSTGDGEGFSIHIHTTERK